MSIFEKDLLFPFLQLNNYQVSIDYSQEGTPEVLYKFRRWDDANHRKIISSREIYFARPKELDEYAEFTIPIDDSIPPDNTLRAFYYQMCLNECPNISESQRFEYVENRLRDFKIKMVEKPKHIEAILKEDDKQLQDKIGIFCTCPDDFNKDLWDNFADGGKGFCVGFKTSKIIANPALFGSVGPINYYAEDTKPIISNISFSGAERISKYLIRVTSIPEDYSSEKEYRFVKHRIIERNIQLDQDYYQEIILGYNMEKKDQEEVIESAKEFLPTIPVYKANYNPQFEFIYVDRSEGLS